jgi:serine/threonine-protein kinase
MALVDGRSALELQRALGRLPIADVARLGEHVARALAAASALGVVHRDVKPSNIVVAADGRATLVDFGIGKQEGTVSSLTRTGIGLGTLLYMAPEQLVDARSATASSDVYALGATLYHLLTGRPVVHGDGETVAAATFAELVRQVAQARPTIGALRPECPPALERLVERMLAEAPGERPTAAEVVAALEELLDDPLARSTPVGGPSLGRENVVTPPCPAALRGDASGDAASPPPSSASPPRSAAATPVTAGPRSLLNTYRQI